MGWRSRRVVETLCCAGINPYQVWCFARHFPKFVSAAWAYDASKPREFPLTLRDMTPVMVDYDGSAGTASGHYFHQDLWAARLVIKRQPARHVDIGSRIDGFVAHILTFMPVTVIDVRPLTGTIEGLSFEQGDATCLDRFASNSVDSISSLHAIEHVGLGRYRDPIDPDGWRKAVAELTRVLKPGGRLYFSVPIGRQRVRFNADRFFRPSTILNAFSSLRVVSHAAVDDAGNLRTGVPLSTFDDAEHSCGLLELTKD